MNKIHFDCPINQLSFGNVAFNFMRELYKKHVDVAIFPQGNNANFESFDKADPKLLEWIKRSAFDRYKKLDKNVPTLKLWHLNGGEQRVAPKQYLYTFYECDSPTQEEIAVVKSQEHVFFSSTESCEHFKKAGCENVSFVPIGFDNDFFKTNKPYLGKDVIHFGLVGKFEKRKNTELIIRTWLKKYGNNPKYQLTCLVNNPFFSPEDFQKIIFNTLDGKRWTNINFLPWLKTNSEVNELLNAVNIDLSGCCFNEGWSLGAFNSACLGSVCVVGMGGAHLDWAVGENIVPISPIGKCSNEDGVFFRRGLPWNQGDFYITNEADISEAMDRAEQLYLSHPEKFDRSDLIDKFSYEKTVDSIMKTIINN
jgi:hypothetical protein